MKMLKSASLALMSACAISAAARALDVQTSGSWMFSTKEDRFGAGGSYLATVASDGITFGVRCIEKEFSYAMSGGSRWGELKPGTIFKFKFRVDSGDIFPGAGIAIDKSLVQIIASPALANSLMGGRELAARVEVNGVTDTQMFRVNGAAKALGDVTRNCPLDKMPVPKFDADGDLDPESIKPK